MKNKYTATLAVILGIIFGAFLGDLLGGFKYFTWLNYGKSVGLNPPFNLDLYVFNLTIGFTINITIASIIGIISAILIYKKM